jgi:hypothetical protein
MSEERYDKFIIIEILPFEGKSVKIKKSYWRL